MKSFEPRLIYINPKQQAFLQARQPRRVFLGGRGSGKSSTLGLANFQRIAALPRGKGFLAGLTYNQILTKILPPAIDMWQMHGLKEYIDRKNPGHFVVGKKPPEHWPLPYQPPRNFFNVISFFNGAAIELISLDRKDTSRGGNYDWGDFDEACLINKEQHDKEIIPSVRGNIYRFKDHPLHHSVFYYSSQAWLPSGQWIPDMIEQATNFPDEVFYIEATAYDNIEVVGKNYIKNLRRVLQPLVFDVEVMNHRLTKLPNAFYESFDEKRHCAWDTFNYEMSDDGLLTKGDKDYRPTEPMLVSFDFNAGFNSCIAAQERDGYTYIIKEFYVKGTRIIDDLVTEVCNYFEAHTNRTVLIYGDRNGNNRQANSELTYYTQMINVFTARKWHCQLMVRERLDPYHRMKFQFINQVLAERDARLPRIRINQNNCKGLIISIQRAPLTPDFKKDKRSERKAINQEEATHLSDAFDNLIHPRYSDLVSGDGGPGTEIGFL